MKDLKTNIFLSKMFFKRSITSMISGRIKKGIVELDVAFKIYTRCVEGKGTKLICKKTVSNIKGYLNYLIIWPVYYRRFSRDCDCYETTTALKFPTYYHAQKAMKEIVEDWSEGPIHFTQLSKKEYKQHTDTARDRILEAFEDGKGQHTVI